MVEQNENGFIIRTQEPGYRQAGYLDKNFMFWPLPVNASAKEHEDFKANLKYFSNESEALQYIDEYKQRSEWHREYDYFIEAASTFPKHKKTLSEKVKEQKNDRQLFKGA